MTSKSGAFPNRVSLHLSPRIGPPRRHQQRDSSAPSAGRRGPESVHQRPAALPHAQLRLPASILPATLPAHLPTVSGPVLARQRPVLSELPARPAAAPAPGLAGPEAEPGEQFTPSAPRLAPPAVSGVSQGGAPTFGPRT